MKLLRDTWLIFQRQLLLVLRNPVWLIVGIIQPVFYLLLFGPLLKFALHAPTAADAYKTFVPGLLVGRSLRDVVSLLFQATIITVLSIPFGLSVRLGDVVLAFLLLGLIALMLSAVSYGIALKLRSEDALAPLLNTVGQPIFLLSGILLPITALTAPGWLRAISRWNPFSWAVDATRALFAGDPGDPNVWKALVILGVLTAVAVMWAARSFARSVR